jgi:hypothetical protein
MLTANCDDESPLAPTARTVDLSALVAESTAAKIRTFLYEIAEGTTNYRSLHSLTQQVEHQYHGRFLVELIQNAHDALWRELGADRARIEIRLASEEAHGALYVANDGSPFTKSNFTSLSQLGQSDKNPQESIGNKGIGFRSVLEISHSPQIFSRCSSSSPTFDGLCFGFTPEVISQLATPMEALAHDGHQVKSPFGDLPLVDWDPTLLAKFRRAVGRYAPGWLATERAYLSPYLLPLPLEGAAAPDTVRSLEAAGFATVLRLPLISAEALALVRRKMGELRTDTALFLERARSLVLDDGETRRHLTRETDVNSKSRLDHQEVRIASGEDGPVVRYNIWSRTIRVADASREFQESIRAMPGKWPELREARVSIAAQITDEPDTGVFSVFLPTLLPTGSAAHVNAPFFADMSRTSIDFEHAYNQGLLDTARDLALDVIRTELVGQGEIEAQLIVDLLAPRAGNVGPGKQWLDGMTARMRAASAVPLAEQPWFLSQSEWSPLNKASLFRPLPQPVVFTEARLREHATFGVFHVCLSTRSRQLHWLSQACGFDVYPRLQDLAETAEVIATVIHKAGGADWNAFWSELRQLLPHDSERLLKRKVLLGRDGVLHSAGEDCTVFFAPRRGVGDEDELANDEAIIEIPPMLQPHVAFLHDSITLYDENTRQTETRRYLDDGLVKRFRVEDIFAEVLIARTPTLPVRLKSAEAALCADILRWGLRLLSNLVDRGIGDRTIHLLKNLAVPCAGGWYRADTTAYGPGWPDSHGGTLERYLTTLLNSEDCKEAARGLLLAPDRPEWGTRATRYRRLLNAAGVFDGLRLNQIEPDTWDSEFYANSGYFGLPEKPPAGIPTVLWEPYRQFARAQALVYYNGTFRYRMATLLAIPGMAHYDRLDWPARRALMDLILASLCQWPGGWERVICRKMTGSPNTPSVRSPLWFVLNQVKWLGFGTAEKTQWSAPPARWHVPAKVLGGRSWQFDHLDPLPPTIAHRLDLDTNLASVLADLGMPQYDLDTPSGSLLLLNALAAAAESNEIRDPNVFLGQVRSAWGAFEPQDTPSLPRKLLVHQEKRLVALTPTTAQPVYIPDSARSFVSSLERFGLPVLAIDFPDANRLASTFIRVYGNAVVLTSTLDVLAVTDGKVWTEGAMENLRDSEFDWVIEVSLTLAAYWGASSRGTGSARFAAQVEAYRQAKVAWCDRLSTRLTTGDHVLEQDVSCLWLPDRKTLLISRSCRKEPMLLSEALAAILERDDLTFQLMFALREIGTDADSEAVLRALDRLRLRPAQYLEVREHWRGTLRHITDLLIPLLTIFYPGADHGALLAARSEEQLSAHLASLQDPRIDAEALLAVTREVGDIYDFGHACFRKYGAPLELDRWNEALALLRERPLQNPNAAAEFAVHAQAALPALRTVLATVLRIVPLQSSARALIAELESTVCPAQLVFTRWEIVFGDAMAAFVPFFERIGAPADTLALVMSSQSADALIEAMPHLGIDPSFEPLEAARQNRRSLQGLVGELQEIGLAWAVGISATLAALWESRTERFMEALDGNLATTGYLVVWSEDETYALLKSLPRDEESQAFWSVLEQSNSLGDLKQFLGITPERLVGAKRELDELREQARRQNRLVSVCGREFDGSDDNLSALWTHITSGLPDDALGEISPIELTTPTNMVPPAKRKPSGQGTGSGYRHPTTPKAQENLVGLAGEIHAFRRLQHQHGSHIVSASAWLSTNSLQVYADKTGVDDAAGCDFRFVVGGKTYHVEVKSSSGADEMFTLGSSEIRLAMELSKSKRSRRKSVFLLLRVLNALSERPVFQVLPNPYDEQYRSLYDIVEAGARVRYRVNVPGVT